MHDRRLEREVADGDAGVTPLRYVTVPTERADDADCGRNCDHGGNAGQEPSGASGLATSRGHLRLARQAPTAAIVPAAVPTMKNTPTTKSCQADGLASIAGPP